MAAKRKAPTRKITTKSKAKTKPKKSTPKTKPQPKPKGGGGGGGGGGGAGTPSGAISVRMYRVGFGDCFLVTLPTAGGPAYVLVDCGVHAKGDAGTLGQIVADIASVTNRKLAIVIASHAHQDHIAGYDRFGTEFATFQIGEVWLPWTWDPSDPQAVQLQGKQAALATQLAAHFAALPPGAAQRPATSAAAAAVANLTGNAHAIALLNTGFGVGAKVRYLKAEDSLADAAGISGLSVKFLGPPHDEAYLAQMDPPANQHYIGLAKGAARDATRIEPFAKSWRAAATRDLTLTKVDEKKLENATTSTVEDLAFALDKARNNESVVALFSYQGQTLLFAGDAQYGNWRWWLEHDQPGQILPQVRFLKVAHHGSINATPKDALEKMTDGNFAAMVSTQSTPWASIPLVPLMARIDQKTKQELVRSDWLHLSNANAPDPSAGAAPPQPANPPAGFTEGGGLWFDYVLKP